MGEALKLVEETLDEALERVFVDDFIKDKPKLHKELEKLGFKQRSPVSYSKEVYLKDKLIRVDQVKLTPKYKFKYSFAGDRGLSVQSKKEMSISDLKKELKGKSN